MSEHKISEAGRAILRRQFRERLLRVGQALRNSPAKFTPVPAKPRLSTRGQRKPSWYTKCWTPSRKRDREEAFA